MKADLLSVVESAYRLELSGQQWLQGVTDAVGPLIDAGDGVYGSTIDFSDMHHLRVGKVVSYRGNPNFVRAIRATNLALSRTQVLDTYRGVPAISTATERVGVARWNAFARPHGPSHVCDCVGVVAVNPQGVGHMFNAPLPHVGSYSERVRKVWARVVAHLVAMQRLRASLTHATLAVQTEGEAVLSASGKVEHALGKAKGPTARELLRAAVVARERARGKVCRQNPAEAVELWRAMVAGRWSIVDRFDRDGRRFLVAHQNEPEAAAPRALTQRERQVLSHAAMGHSNKLIAYELGLSVGTVSAYLNVAMRKLGLDSRVALARLLQAVRGMP